MPYVFGRYELRPEDRTLLQDGVPLDLRGRSVDLLRVLVERRSRVVANDELLRLAWPRLAVGEDALDEEIARLRGILGADTISGGGGRGYRLNIELDGDAHAAAVEGGPSAVLNADVVRDGTGDRQFLGLRRLLLARMSELVAANSGEVTDSTGAFQAKFAAASDAFRCARAIQGESGHSGATLPEALRARIRIGLHVVESQPDGSPEYAEGLVVAAQLQGLCEPGGVCLSGAAFDRIRSDLGHRGHRDGGFQRLQGVARPVHVHHVDAGRFQVDSGKKSGYGSAPEPESAVLKTYRFDRCEIRPERRQVLVGGVPTKLGARALDILLLLIEHRDRVVSRTEIFERVWPRSVVVDGNLQVHIFALRKILGSQTIATIPGRGYRFTAELEADAGPPVVRAVQAAAPDAPPTPHAALQFKSNLPEAPVDLFGRESDLAEVRALVSRHRLVTITGPGGIGKTRLAQRLAVEQRAEFRNGVCWVDLSSVQEPKLVPSAMGSDLGVPSAHGEFLEALVQALKDAQVLIVLDNAEHLIDAVAVIASKLLEQTQAVRLLVTSQVPLRSSREVQFRLGNIAVPDDDDLTPEEAMTYGAIQLFAQRAAAVDRHFVLGEHSLRAVIDVCRQLDAIPLAIELAAARVGTIGLARLAGSLDERLRLLTGGARDAPRRQQTLLATMQWSHSLLLPQERVVFRRLGVFRSGFGLELAQRVAADEAGRAGGRNGGTPNDQALDEWSVLERLSTLVDHSLVAVDPGETPRYRLLETARLFALENLDASGETLEVTNRFAQAIHARFVRQEEDLWSGVTAVDAGITALEPDLPNFRAALQWSIGHDAELAVGLASTLEHAVTNGRMEEMVAIFDATEPLAQTVGEPLRARWALAYARNLNTERGLKARHWAGCAFDIYSRLGPPERRHLALAAKLMCELAGGHPSIASEWSALRDGEQREWSDYVKSVGPRALALRGYYEGDFQAAISAGRELLQMAERCGSSLLIKTTKLDLAEFARSLGRLDECIRVLAELVEVIHPVQERNLAALAWINLFGARLAAGKLADAREAARRASEHMALAQVQHWWADGAALLAALEGRPRAAARLIGYADAIYEARSFVRQPNESVFRESSAAASRQQMSDEHYRQLLGAGAKLSDEAAIGIGLGIVDF